MNKNYNQFLIGTNELKPAGFFGMEGIKNNIVKLIATSNQWFCRFNGKSFSPGIPSVGFVVVKN